MPVGLRNLDAEMLAFGDYLTLSRHGLKYDWHSMKIHRASTYVEIIASLLQIEDETLERIDAPCRK